MSFRLVCELSGRFAAIAVSAGTRDNSGCRNMQPLSIMYMHGTADPLQPYEGGPDVRDLVVPPVTELISFWQRFNGCPSQPETRMLTSVVEERVFGPCQSGTEVRLYTVIDGMHCWPGIDVNTASCRAGGPHMTLDATSLAVTWLLAHPRQQAAGG
jgi:polyhydroxybutyrate depolymerase